MDQGSIAKKRRLRIYVFKVYIQSVREMLDVGASILSEYE